MSTSTIEWTDVTSAGGRLLDGRTWDEYPGSPTAGELTA
jgi:hypothetical protein